MLSTSTATLSTSTSTSTRADINPAQRILTTGDERQSPSPSPLSCSQTSPAQSRSPQSVPICVHPWLKNQHLSNRSITDFKPNQTMSPFAGRLSAAPCQRRFWSVSSTSTAALSTTKSCQGCGNGAIILLSPSWSLQKQQPTFTPPQCIATARRKPQRQKHLRTNSQMDGPSFEELRAGHSCSPTRRVSQDRHRTLHQH